MTKLSDDYPNLINKVYCDNCIFHALNRKDGVVTGSTYCIKGWHTATYFDASKCSDFVSKINLIKKINGGR